MKKYKIYSITGALIVFLFVFVWLSQSTYFVFNKESGDSIQSVTQDARALIGDTTFFVDIADTVAKRKKGLSNREFLQEDRGMLFVYDSASRGGIWMKDMLFPIDIIWFDKDLRVVVIKENAEPSSYPEVFYPKKDIWYVFEVNAGVVEKNNIIAGDNMKIF